MCFFIAGCGNKGSHSDIECHLDTSYRVQYIGEAFGYGTISIERIMDGSSSHKFTIVVEDALNTNEPVIAIEGMAQCRSGVLAGEFASGKTNRASVKMLGGRFVGVFNSEGVTKPFGRWNLKLHDSGRDKSYDFGGFWEQIYH